MKNEFYVMLQAPDGNVYLPRGPYDETTAEVVARTESRQANLPLKAIVLKVVQSLDAEKTAATEGKALPKSESRSVDEICSQGHLPLNRQRFSKEPIVE